MPEAVETVPLVHEATTRAATSRQPRKIDIFQRLRVEPLPLSIFISVLQSERSGAPRRTNAKYDQRRISRKRHIFES
jgi:hypothetical protein